MRVTTLKKRLLAIMKDGRERTFQDMMHHLQMDDLDKVRDAARKLTREKKLRTREKCGFSIYRVVQ